MVHPAPVTNAADNERAKAADEGVESPVSDDAQQLSAWACVTGLLEAAPGSVDPCIGQAPLLEQQAIRASGEVCQPAHSAHPAAASVRATTKAVVRLTSSSTILGCTGARLVSIQWGTCPQRDRAALASVAGAAADRRGCCGPSCRWCSAPGQRSRTCRTTAPPSDHPAPRSRFDWADPRRRRCCSAPRLVVITASNSQTVPSGVSGRGVPVDPPRLMSAAPTARQPLRADVIARVEEVAGSGYCAT